MTIRTVTRQAEERIFSLPVSFFALISGALIGTATNLLTSLVFAQDVKIDVAFLKLGILSIFISSFSFGWVSLILEQLHGQVTGDDEKTKTIYFLNLIHQRQEILSLLTFIGLASILTGIILIDQSSNP